MTALAEVLASPHSVAARARLLEEWKLSAHPQARLLELQLMEHRGLGFESRYRVPDEIRRILRTIEVDWKSRRPYVKGCTYELGLVAWVGMSGASFVEHGDELVREAPILVLTLDGPIDLVRVASIPALQQLRELAIVKGDWIDDAGIEHLARSPYLRELRALNVRGGSLTHRGLSALAAMDLPNLIYIDVAGNPGAETHPKVIKLDERRHIIGRAGEHLLDEAIAATALGYSGRAEWPPLDSTFLFDNDE